MNPEASFIKTDKIIVDNELKIIKKEGDVETPILFINQAGTISSGKSKAQQNTSETGLIMKSQNGHRWKIQVSDTGQLVTTDLGV